MIKKLTSNAELQAIKAEEFPAFSGIKLLHIKRQLEILLSLIGRNGIFDEYTKHDISHMDKMLKILDWLIPEDTQKIMSPSDWLMTVLAIYFHDLGMLVTPEEYKQGSLSGYPDYRDNVLFSGDFGIDYRSKVEGLNSQKAERFLYQEFVRHIHAKRISNWILGHAPDHLGKTHTAMKEVDTLLKPFSQQFRRDLAFVCESHHLDDLNEFGKYKISQPYGNSDEETVNLHYCAILLRTSDLLHITSDRTPSIAFRIICPSDPLSQEEWAKQMAVTRVRSKTGVNRDGIPDEKAPRDTIEIHAYFTQENGFFGLTSYLTYLENQIRKSHNWAQMAIKSLGSQYSFPWRYIDDSHIETEGFLRDTYEFTIDQARILDLLTGHTLYNDTRIVLRELMQNALDAIRLQQIIDRQKGVPSEEGKIQIHWDSQQRILSIQDNGTGMTHDVILRHLLKVGASLYQDVDFKRKFPNFSPISQFGIGLLTTFMIADIVEIFTSHPDDKEARHLSLRSVHGKYLIRLLNKETDSRAKRLGNHGTIVKIKVRPSAEMSDVLQTAKRWVAFPKCKVTVIIDKRPSVSIGFSSPKEMLEDFLKKNNISIYDDNTRRPQSFQAKVEQRSLGAVTLAYAVEWIGYFNEWSFINPERFHLPKEGYPIGVCAEGIKIDFCSPGYNFAKLLAIANTEGPNAPKTSVIRSDFEDTKDRTAMNKAIYSIYCDHLKSEMEELYKSREFSMTWAVQELRYLLFGLSEMKREEELVDESVFVDVAKELPILIEEVEGKRKPTSIKDLSQKPIFWTIDCQLLKSAELLFREVPSKASFSKLIKSLEMKNFQVPKDPTLCELYRGYALEGFDPLVFEGKEVDTIRIYKGQRRIDLRWVKKSKNQRWFNYPSDLPIPSDLTKKIRGYHPHFPPDYLERLQLAKINIGKKPIKILGRSDEIGIKAFGVLYIFQNSSLAKFLIELMEHTIQVHDEKTIKKTMIICGFISYFLVELKIEVREFITEDLWKEYLEQTLPYRSEVSLSDLSDFIDVIKKSQLKIFDTSAWERRRDL